MNKKHTGLMRLSRATVYSVQGIRAAWRHEAAFRQEIVLGALAIAVACWLDIDAISRLLLILPVILVAVVELLNSAIEALIDRVSPERHPLCGQERRMKINVVGTSGKSTLFPLAIPYMDALFWQPNWTPSSDAVFFARLEQALAQAHWC